MGVTTSGEVKKSTIQGLDLGQILGETYLLLILKKKKKMKKWYEESSLWTKNVQST